MGFSQGLFAGSAVAQRGMDNYDKRQNEEIQGKLFELANEEQAMAEGDQEVGNIMEMVGQSSMGDIQKSLADAYVASGGKMDAKVYNAINLFSQGLFDVKEKAVGYTERRAAHEQKKTLFGKQSEIEKRTKLMQNADYIRGKYGDEAAQKYIASNWKVKEYPDDGISTESPKEDSKETKKPSWKDFIK